MTVLVQKSHDWLPLSTDYDEVCEMLQNLGQNTCTMNGNGAAALHCGQSLGGHSLLYQDAGQTVFSKGIPTPYTKKTQHTQTKIKKKLNNAFFKIGHLCFNKDSDVSSARVQLKCY